MIKTDYVNIVDFKAKEALFTMMESKGGERYSYPFPTPSALIGALKNVLWKPRIDYQVERIDILNPIEYYMLTSCEVGKWGSFKIPYIDVPENKDLRHSQMLKNVHYRAWIRILFYNDEDLPEGIFSRTAEIDESPGKYNNMLRRRLKAGAYFRSPYLGIRECRADLSLVSPKEAMLNPPLDINLAPRPMLYGIDYKTNRRIMFMAEVKHGIVAVPPVDSDKLYYV